MIKKIQEYIDFKLVGVALIVSGLAACNAMSSVPASNGSNSSQTAVYTQIERLGRPAVKEAFESFNNHDTTNRTNPYNDAVLSNEIASFTNNFRAPQFGQTLQAILIPDELQADLSQTVPASYLGVETNGATGGKFGGRGLTDDVIDTSLGAIFGKTLVTVAGVTDDNKEIPCLTTDNEPGANTADGNTTIASITAKNGVSATFPYLGTAK
jgi:hypothetical protein